MGRCYPEDSEAGPGKGQTLGHWGRPWVRVAASFPKNEMRRNQWQLSPLDLPPSKTRINATATAEGSN